MSGSEQSTHRKLHQRNRSYYFAFVGQSFLIPTKIVADTAVAVQNPSVISSASPVTISFSELGDDVMCMCTWQVILNFLTLQ